MLRPEAEAGPAGQPERERQGDLAAAHVAVLGHPVGDLVERTAREVGEHQLRHRPHAGQRRADRRADNGLLRDGRVPDPVPAELRELPPTFK